MIRIEYTETHQEMSRRAANILSAVVQLQPRCVLGLATGSSPLGVYALLVERFRRGDLDFSGVTTINLDEYRGLGPDHPQSYRRFMQDNFFAHVNIRPEAPHLPDGLAQDAGAECARYDGIIEAAGVDLQLLGIGHNGHIGFNEPGAAFPNRTHLTELSESTIRANRRFFDSEEEVPRQAFTMGVGSIMRARKIVVIASGSDKADIVREAFTGPVTPQVPASILQLHGDVTLVGDREALAGLAGTR